MSSLVGSAPPAGALVLSATPGARVIGIQAKGEAAGAEASALEFAAQFSPREQIQSPRAGLPQAARAPASNGDESVEDVFRALEEIAAAQELQASGSQAVSRPRAPAGITHDDIRAHEKSSAASGLVRYAPAVASALRGDLERLGRRERIEGEASRVAAGPGPRVTPPGLKLPAPVSPASSGGSEHGGFDSARTDGTIATLSECCTEMSQMTTPRHGGPSSGGGSTAHSTHKESEKEMAPSTAAANRLFKAAELPLDQIDEDTDAELEMFREQQEMIAQMCKVKADAYLAREKEKEEEEMRKREQLQLMRLEQMQLIRLQELAKKREQFQARAANRPVSAPVKRTAVARPPAFKAAALVEDLDVLNMSCCTETLSPGLQARAAEAGLQRDVSAWNSPTRAALIPERASERREAAGPGDSEAGAGQGVTRVKPRPKSAFSRLMSSLGTKRWRAAIVPLPKSLMSSSSPSRSLMKGMSFGASRRKNTENEVWASEGIPIIRFPSSASDAANP